MWGNVPDDWDMYYYKCSECGYRYHASEGGCTCIEERKEQMWDEVIRRLTKGEIEEVDIEDGRNGLEDDLGEPLSNYDIVTRVYLKEKDGYDELIFSENNWEDVAKAIGYEYPEEE
jgi:hypothetical protein